MPSPAQEQLALPLESWHELDELRTREGKRLRRWGSVREARKILNDCRRHDLYDLIHAGEIDAYQLKPGVPRSKFRVDLLSVWRFRERQMTPRG